jgi:hypothetical protein
MRALYIVSSLGLVKVPDEALKNLDWTSPLLMWL